MTNELYRNKFYNYLPIHQAYHKIIFSRINDPDQMAPWDMLRAEAFSIVPALCVWLDGVAIVSECMISFWTINCMKHNCDIYSYRPAGVLCFGETSHSETVIMNQISSCYLLDVCKNLLDIEDLPSLKVWEDVQQDMLKWYIINMLIH